MPGRTQLGIRGLGGVPVEYQRLSGEKLRLDGGSPALVVDTGMGLPDNSCTKKAIER
jgi:hypothetical protein